MKSQKQPMQEVQHKLNKQVLFLSMKKNKTIIITLIILGFYLIQSHFTHKFIPCIFHEVTGLYCPGCGVTRMFLSLLKGDIKQAFFYNQLLFISLPFFLILIGNNFIANLQEKTPLYKKIPNQIYIFYIILLLLFMIIRNIFPYFSPTTI